MTIKYFIVFLFLPTLLFGQSLEELTANQIIDSSLAFCGGETRIARLNSSRVTYQITQPDQTTAIVNEQLKAGTKYVQCVLSKRHTPQTTFFDGKKISVVNGDSVFHTTDIQSYEAIKLKTYNHIQYGYKQLKYQLTRLPDQKFEHFDCMVVLAESENGYITMNFFDKTNFRLLMIIYPNGNKSLLINYVFKDSILFNSYILNTFPNSDKNQTFELQSIHLNPDISDTWFNCPYTDTVVIPDYIKQGKFVSTNGADTRFTRTDISMDYTDKNGILILRRFLAWSFVSPDVLGLIDEQALINDDRSSQSEILVRIVSWDKNGYVCQWVTDTNTDTHDYKIVR